MEDIKTHKSSLKLTYTPIYDGIQYIKIPGAMDNECLMITYPESTIDQLTLEYSNSPEVKNIYETLSKADYNSKNVILLSYKDI